MPEILDKLPVYAVLGYLILKLLQKTIEILANKFPALADRHFSAKAEEVAFEQQKEIRNLEDRLAESELARNLQRDREKFYKDMTMQSTQFAQTVLLTKITGLSEQVEDSEENLVARLEAIKNLIVILTNGKRNTK